MDTFGAALVGGLLQETLHWYSLKKTLDADVHKKILRSAPYWIITVLMIGLSAVGTLIWYGDFPARPPLREYMLVGAAFPTIFRKLVAAAANADAPLGVTNTNSLARSLRAYFR